MNFSDQLELMSIILFVMHSMGHEIPKLEFVYKYQIVPMVTEQIPNNESQIRNFILIMHIAQF